MNSNLFFNDATLKIAGFPELEGTDFLVIRDLAGRIRVAINQKRSEIDKSLLSKMEEAIRSLGAYAPSLGTEVLCSDDFIVPEAIFNSPDILQFTPIPKEREFRLLDRSIGGQDWLRVSHDAEIRKRAPRIALYGIKGGVGRSTATMIAAYELARQGKRVLVMDLDLESPGLSTLLPRDALPKFGLVDWFVENGVGQADEVLGELTARSPLSNALNGVIQVAPAMGSDDNYYVAKLSRAYKDVSRSEGILSFGECVKRVTNALEQEHKPDVILIDSRAGVHDLAAISIVGLSDYAFLFASGTDATWQGYRALFSHWQTFPEVARTLRERLSMVYALFPELNQEQRKKQFIEQSYNLFSETLYDDIAPSENPPDAFSFDMQEEDAPHYPRTIQWNNRFQEFHPDLLRQNIFHPRDIDATFGEFLGSLNLLLEGSHP